MRIRSGILVITSALLISCFEPENNQPGPPGTVSLSITLARTLPALLKTSSADTNFNLDSLKIILSATGQATQTYAYSISGNAAQGNISVSAKSFTLASLIMWKAKILTIDTTLNPAKSDTVHLDSVTFSVNPSSTTSVSKTINPVFSILRVNIFSNQPDSLAYNVKFIRIRVDGVVRDSMIIGDTLSGIDFPSTTTGFAVGWRGLILGSTNSGANWKTQSSGTTQNLRAVYFQTNNVGYVSGASGTILNTGDGGASWTLQTSGTAQNLNSIHCNTQTVCWTVGNNGVILKTSDGGTNWTAQTSGTTQNLNAVYFQNGTTGWAVGNNGVILKTSDGGTNWTAQTSGTTLNLNSVKSQTTTTAWVAGDSGVILGTTNSGTNWTAQTSGTTQNLNRVYFQNASTGWVVGNNGTLLNSTNGGATWTAQTSGTGQNLVSVVSTTTTQARAAGLTTILYTSNGGTAWTSVAIGKLFNELLTYKYLTPAVSHTVLMEAIDTLWGALRGYQASKVINMTAGRDSTITASSMTACGGIKPACIP